MRPFLDPAPARTARLPALAPSTAVRALCLCLISVSVLVLAGGVALAGGRAEGISPPPTTTGWVRPVPGDVLHHFDPPASTWSPGHRGVDLAAGPGQAVRSPTSGTVSFAGAVAGKPVVVVTHDGGLRSTFEPATVAVARGTTVSAGDVVAHRATGGSDDAGGAHCAALGCVHWGVLRGESYLDPLTLLGEDVPIVLLPPTGGA